MNKKLLLFLLVSNLAFSQTNNWFQYAKPSSIYDIQFDSSGNMHCATNIGYVKLDNNGQLIGFKNLTSQNFPVGSLKKIAINPNNEDFLYAVSSDKEILAFNENGTVEIAGITENLEEYNDLQIYWAKSGVLYIYGKGNNYYQTVENGVLSAKKDLGFVVQKIIENTDGSKAFFSTLSGQLWELNTNNNTWTTYTKANGDFNGTTLYDMVIDSNDVLYVSHYQGFFTFSGGIFTEYSKKITPTSLFNFPCFQIDVHPTNGQVLVRNSEANGSVQVGFSTVDTSTNTWTNYTDDNSNCVNENSFDIIKYSKDGSKIIAIETRYFSTSTDVFFDPVNNNCSPINFNYLNAENVDVYSTINVRSGKTDNTIDVGIINNDGFGIFTLPEQNFDGNFPAVTNVIPNENGETQYHVLSAKDKFIVTNNQKKLQFVDEDNNIISHQLTGIGDGGIINAKVAGLTTSNTSQPIIFNAFNNGSERRVYITDCDFSNNSCKQPIELFTTNRDLTSNTAFTCTEKSETEFLCGLIKKNASNITAVELLEYDTTTETATQLFDEEVASYIVNITKDLFFYDTNPGDNVKNPVAHFLNDQGTELNAIEKENGNTTITNTYTLPDSESYSLPDFAIKGRKIYLSDEGDVMFLIAAYFEKVNENGANTSNYTRKRFRDVIAFDNNTNRNNSTLPHSIIAESTFDNLPKNLTVYQSIRYANSASTYSIMMRTNYGLLFKTNIPFSSTLSTTKINVGKQEVLVYPNPSNGKISIKGVAVKQLILYDLQGRKIAVSNSENLSVNNAKQGVYLLNIKTDKNQTINKKVIIN